MEQPTGTGIRLHTNFFHDYLLHRLGAAQFERSGALYCRSRFWSSDVVQDDPAEVAADVLARVTSAIDPPLRVVYEEHSHKLSAIELVLCCAQGRTFAEFAFYPEGLTANIWAAPEPCEALLERIDGAFQRDRSPAEVPVRFWFHDGEAHSISREIECPDWSEISRNYLGLEAPLAELMALDQPYRAGRLVFWHGPPGTGKTYVIRALLRGWPGAAASVITDPEAFFGSPAYMYKVLLDQIREKNKFELLVIEDCPDLVLEQCRGAKGQMMGRLLNLTDGLIGQGLRLVILITTNERIERIDPAFTRPGRALQVLEFRRFRPDEATRWLDQNGATGPGLDGQSDWSLAELYALLAGRRAQPDCMPRLGFSPAQAGARRR